MKRYRGRREVLSGIAYLVLGAVIFCGAHAVAEAVAPTAEAEEPVAPVVVVVEETPEAEPVAEPEPISLGKFKLTHYCPKACCCGEYADGYTATGTLATEGRTIAVDPKVIPYGTEVRVVYEDGTEAMYIAEDCGGSIKGNRIDVFMNSHEAALVEGVKYAEVYILEEV